MTDKAREIIEILDDINFSLSGVDKNRLYSLVEGQQREIDKLRALADDYHKRFINAKQEITSTALAVVEAERDELQRRLDAANRIISATADLLQQWEPDYPSDYDKDLMLEIFRAKQAIKRDAVTQDEFLTALKAIKRGDV